ncbi:MAG: hypothetical protein AUH33_01060 [Chloroflexi bacterium 13_1_40CM_68_21]|nr:MAG: hypothetical protein AUH33_01060 [Chloroflexi bacterium 13_1_40CM_68_21]
MRPDDDLFDEALLRRALRLESSELPPRLDIAAIAARAEDGPLGLASLASSLFAGLATATLLATGAVTISSLAPAIASDTFAAAISLIAWIAVPLEAAVRTMQQPTVPIAALAAVVFAVAYEYRTRKERANA